MDNNILLLMNQLDSNYKKSTDSYKNNKDFRKKVDETTIKLQAHDGYLLFLHRMISIVSLAYVYEIYDILGVKLSIDDVRGESSYSGIRPITKEELKMAPSIARFLNMHMCENIEDKMKIAKEITTANGQIPYD